MARIEIRGTALEYVKRGSGDPLVLVHGSASDYRTWQDQLDDFGRRFRTIAYSRRYHWPNALDIKDTEARKHQHAPLRWTSVQFAALATLVFGDGYLVATSAGRHRALTSPDLSRSPAARAIATTSCCSTCRPFGKRETRAPATSSSYPCS